MGNGTRHSQGQVLVISLVATVVMAFLGLGLMQLAQQSASAESIAYRKAQSLWRVHGGVEYAVWNLLSTDVGSAYAGQAAPDSAYNWGYNGETLSYPLGGGSEADTSLVAITVSAPMASDPSIRAIRAETDVFGKTAAARHLIDVNRPPPALNLAILTEDSLNVGGNTIVTSHSGAQGTLNADIHTNQNLSVDGSSVVNGFATASGEANVSGTVAPPVNPGNLPPYFEGVSPVDIPNIDPASFASIADVTISNPKSIPMNAVLDFGGTPDDPTIVYLKGDWQPAGHTYVRGNCVLVINGKLKTAGLTYLEATAGGQFSVIASFVDLKGTSEIHGVVYAREEFHSSGTAAIYGSAISKSYDPATGKTKVGSVFTGNFDVYYQPHGENLLPGPPTAARLSYQTRGPGESW